MNRIQLTVYFGIGKYISQHTRKGVWGTDALEAISDQLRRELPGLRGFSATSLKKMRLFYDNYIHRTAEEHLSVDALKKLLRDDAYGHREQMPSNFSQTENKIETSSWTNW